MFLNLEEMGWLVYLGKGESTNGGPPPTWGVVLMHTHVVPLCVQAPVRLSARSQAVISHPSGLMRACHAVVPWMVDPGETPAQGLGSVPFRQGIWSLEEGQSDAL